MKKLLLIALLALITFGCRTVKQTSTNEVKSKVDNNLTVKTSDKANFDIKLSTNNQLKVDSSKLIVDKGSVTETTVEESTTTNFSAPDATGKQSIESQTKTKKTTVKGEKKDLKVNQNVNSKSDQETNLSDKSDYKSEASAVDKGKTNISDKSTNKKTEETETPGWVYVLVSVSFLVLLGVVYGVLKRFGVIK